jgi:molybdopterin synthase catalytic subunit
MAEKVMHKICDDIRLKWPDIENICIYHRLGLVPVKEASVILAVSSPHRNSSLESLPYGMELLKKSVPIFKREFYKDSNSSSEWKENPECRWSKKHNQLIKNNNNNNDNENF